MLKEAKKYIGKKMDLMVIRNLFPDSYVAVDEYNIEGGASSGVLIYVCKNQRELNPILIDYSSKGIKLSCFYTTEKKGMTGYAEYKDIIED